MGFANSTAIFKWILIGLLTAASTRLRAHINDDKNLQEKPCEALLAGTLEPWSPHFGTMNPLIRFRVLPEPVTAYRWTVGGDQMEKMELAEIVSVKDPTVQSMIEFVQERGGQVRLIQTRVSEIETQQFIRWRHEEPYFWVNLDPRSSSYLIPVIGINLNGRNALASLAHEIEHFKIWLEEFQNYLDQGLDRGSASRAAVDKVWEVDMIAYGERKAVNAELRAERKFAKNIFNQRRGRFRPSRFWHEGFVNRMTYPEYQAVRMLLQAELAGRPFDQNKLTNYLSQMIQMASETRMRALSRVPTKNKELRQFWENTSITSLLIEPFGVDRLKMDKTLELFKAYIATLCPELTTGQEICQ